MSEANPITLDEQIFYCEEEARRWNHCAHHLNQAGNEALIRRNYYHAMLASLRYLKSTHDLGNTQEIPPVTTPETGWVICEHTSLSLLYLALLMEYECGKLAGDGISPIGWSWSSLRALRFAREADAQAFVEAFKLKNVKIEEHAWG